MASASTSTLHNSSHKSDLVYPGSDAEYIISKSGGSSPDRETYVDVALPILKLQFPRNRATDDKLSADRIAKLNLNEPECIEKSLNDKSLTSQPIPKTLYDLFYVAFRIDQLAEILKKGGKEGCQLLDEIEECEIPIIMPERDSTLESIHDVFLENEEEPSFSKLRFELNKYILDCLKQEGLEGKVLNQENILGLVDKLWPKVSMENMEEDLRKAVSSLRKGQCPFGANGKRHPTGVISQIGIIFRVSQIFETNSQSLLELFKETISLECSQEPSYYTLYRLENSYSKGSQSSVDFTSYPNFYQVSTALGNSLLSGSAAKDAVSLKLSLPTLKFGETVYRVKIKKEDFYKGEYPFLELPPSKGLARLMQDHDRAFCRINVPNSKTRKPLEVVKGCFGSNVETLLELTEPQSVDESAPIKPTQERQPKPKTRKFDNIYLAAGGMAVLSCALLVTKVASFVLGGVIGGVALLLLMFGLTRKYRSE